MDGLSTKIYITPLQSTYLAYAYTRTQTYINAEITKGEIVSDILHQLLLMADAQYLQVCALLFCGELDTPISEFM